MRNIRIHYLQHVPFEGLGYIERWALENKHQLTSTQLYEQEDLPRIEEVDWLIIMGGPMNIYEENQYPWLVKEKVFIRDFIEANKPVLGICLGSQLIASVLGAEVRSNADKEIGWLPIQYTSRKHTISLFDGIPEEESIVFHWHGDTFDLPEGATLIASSEGCANQAFIYNGKVVGLQYHMEVTEESMQNMIDNGWEELEEKGRYIQDIQTIANGKKKIGHNTGLFSSFLDRMALLCR